MAMPTVVGSGSATCLNYAPLWWGLVVQPVCTTPHVVGSGIVVV
jgi:hypothetical protein